MSTLIILMHLQRFYINFSFIAVIRRMRAVLIYLAEFYTLNFRFCNSLLLPNSLMVRDGMADGTHSTDEQTEQLTNKTTWQTLK